MLNEGENDKDGTGFFSLSIQVPVITDRNPHLEGILDQRRIIYLPYTEDKNLFLELPNSPGLFFTTQRLNFGAEIFMLEDTTIHKNWIVLINEVFFHGRVSDTEIKKLMSDPSNNFMYSFGK